MLHGVEYCYSVLRGGPELLDHGDHRLFAPVVDGEIVELKRVPVASRPSIIFGPRCSTGGSDGGGWGCGICGQSFEDAAALSGLGRVASDDFRA